MHEASLRARGDGFAYSRATMLRLRTDALLPLLAASMIACGGAAEKPPVAPETTQKATPSVVTNETTGTVKELHLRASEALLAQKYKEAIVALEALRAADPSPQVYFDLGVAYEAILDNTTARARYVELETKYPSDALVRACELRHANVALKLELWDEAEKLSVSLLARSNDDMARLLGLGVRALHTLHKGDDSKAMHDIQDGIDLVEAKGYGTSGRLPVAVALLKFGLGEVKRVRSEKISFQGVATKDFLTSFNERCAMLMDAQASYTDAIRSEDPQWAAISGFQVGVMYKNIHRDIMAIPPTKKAKTKDDQELFFAMMHVRYRVLLEKGGDMMDRVIALGDKIDDRGNWIEKARTTKAEIVQAIADEHKLIADSGYDEKEVQKAWDILRDKQIKAKEDEQKKLEKKK